MVRRLAALSWTLALAAFASSQQGFQGADAALRAVEARKKSPATPASLTKRIAAFGSGKGVAPATAAARWLAFFDEMEKSGETDLGTLVGGLPAPEAWDAIVAGLRSREAGKKGLHAESVRFFAAVLKGNAAEEWRALDALAAAPKGGPNASGFASGVLAATQALADLTGDRTRLAAAFSAALDAKVPANQRGNDVVQVPDLVTLVGSAKAQALLTRAMTETSKRLALRNGRETRALAQRVALANVKALKVPQWDLVDEGTPRLYEAMAARFKAKEDARERAQARSAYMFALLAEGKRMEAAKVAQTLDSDGVYYGHGSPTLQRMVGTPEFTAFLGAAVAGRPNSPLWDLYIASSARSRESGKVVASLRRELAKPNVSARAELLARLSTALLAADQVDEGLVVLEKAIATGGEDAQKEQLAIRYVRVGYLLNRPAAVEKGLGFVRTVKARQEKNRGNGYYGGGNTGLYDLLLDLGRPVEAERMAIDAYVQSATQEGAGFRGYADSNLVALAQLYYRLDRPEDVRRLLDGAAEWGASDAIDLAKPSYAYGDEEAAPIGFAAAWALAKTGDKAGAEAMLGRVLASNSGFDPAYALLRELKGADAIPRLNAIFASDPFQERPLIWKAVALKDAGRLPEAETTIRQAIAVDPSDGETHGGRRLYAYTVLADIQAARGDAQAATESRSAVAAIRLAERSDELAAAGLLTRAIAGYEESTRLFSDAYCIQSRLAVDLMRQGRDKEAEEHYRRAYELMPTSFGRVETHCMGCEGVFEGDLAQNTAERVFSSLVKKTPDKPQVHYLLGFLRFEQGRLPEALASYRRAVALDPDYLNAWKQMQTIAAQTPVPAAERRAISDAILRLDPLQKHGNESPSGDPRTLWRRVDTALSAAEADAVASAHPLPASAAAAAKMSGMMGDDFPDMDFGYGLRFARTPGAAVRMHPLVQAATQLADSTRQGGGASMVGR